MPKINPGHGIYLTNSSGGVYAQGAPVLQDHFVGVAVKQVNGQTSDGFAAQTQIAASEHFFLITKGEVMVTDPGGVSAGDPLYISSAGALTGTVGAGDEVQRITVDATAGQYKLTFSAGGAQQTADIAFNASATTGGASVRALLEALSNIDPGDVVVTGGPGDAGGTTPYVVTFGGQYIDTNVPQMTVQAGTAPLSGGAGTATVATVSGGVVYQRFGRVSAKSPSEGVPTGKLLVDLSDKNAVAGSAF